MKGVLFVYWFVYSNLLVAFAAEPFVSAMVSSVHCVHGFAVVGGRVLGSGVDGFAVEGCIVGALNLNLHKY